MDHKVPLQGAGRRVAGADTNDYPAGVQRTVRGNPAAYCGQRLRAARSRTCASATGGGISGLEATSPPPAATSRTMSYFSIFTSTNLPAPAGSYSDYIRFLAFKHVA